MNGHDSVSPALVKRVAIDGAVGNNTVVAAVSGRRIRVLQFYLRQAAAGTVKFQSSTTTDLTGTIPTTTGDLVIDSGFNPFGHFETVAGELLNLALGTATADGWLIYQEA